MKHDKLDSIDLKILAALQEDGRMTNVDLAKHVGISAPPCLRRVRALEQSGIIRGYHAEVEPAALGYGVSAFALVGLNGQSEAELTAFEQTVTSWPEVRECHMLAGETDFLLRIAAKDWDAYQKFITTRLTPLPNVSHVKSALAIRTAKSRSGVHIEAPQDK